jgi:imidazolonepropionase
LGSTTVEIKSGYGLRIDDELKILRVIQRLGKHHPCLVIPTFMGAHAVPSGSTSVEYVTNLISQMLPRIAHSRLVEFCDVFCERGAFSSSESEEILHSAHGLGLKLKIHADQFSESGGLVIANRLRVTSADHLVYSPRDQIEMMVKTNVTPVLLPSSSYSQMNGNRADAKKMIAMGLPVALGTDFSPSNWTLGQLTTSAFAARELRMSAPDIIRGITINAARALGLEERIGCLRPGRQADLVTLHAPSHKWIGYTYGDLAIDNVLIGGQLVVRNGRRIR